MSQAWLLGYRAGTVCDTRRGPQDCHPHPHPGHCCHHRPGRQHRLKGLARDPSSSEPLACSARPKPDPQAQPESGCMRSFCFYWGLGWGRRWGTWTPALRIPTSGILSSPQVQASGRRSPPPIAVMAWDDKEAVMLLAWDSPGGSVPTQQCQAQGESAAQMSGLVGRFRPGFREGRSAVQPLGRFPWQLAAVLCDCLDLRGDRDAPVGQDEPSLTSGVAWPSP